MEQLKQLIIHRFKIISLLTVSIIFSIAILMIRMKLTHSFFYLFLVWNLFLAVIPFAITTYLVNNSQLDKIRLLLWFCVWLIFLPNAPYIVTDLLHLKISLSYFLWMDILVVMAFALNGLLLFYISLIDMRTLLNCLINQKYTSPIISLVLFLCGFGVYLGRFLRYNSWEIIQNPLSLFEDISAIILYPKEHLEAWLFTFVFGCFLSVGYWMSITLFKA